MAKLLTMVEAQWRLRPYEESMIINPHRTATAAWRRWAGLMPDEVSALNPTSRANVIHDWIERQVREVIPDLDGVVDVSSLGFFAVSTHPDLLLRFKFVGNGGPANIATDQQRALAKQMYDDEMMALLTLDGLTEPPTLLTCGYTLDYEMEISRLTIQCDYDKVTLWRYCVLGNAGGETGFEVQPLLPGSDPEPARIISKKAASRPVWDLG